MKNYIKALTVAGLLLFGCTIFANPALPNNNSTPTLIHCPQTVICSGTYKHCISPLEFPVMIFKGPNQGLEYFVEANGWGTFGQVYCIYKPFQYVRQKDDQITLIGLQRAYITPQTKWKKNYTPHRLSTYNCFSPGHPEDCPFLGHQ